MAGRRIEVSVEEQVLRLFEDGQVIRCWPISTGRNGVGTEPDSLRTPTGEFEICRKIGGDAPLRTIFRSRQPQGEWNPEEPTEDDLILSRILWLHGLEEHNANTRERYIYIHGTNQEHLLGQPASHGCIRMRNADVIELFDCVEEGATVRIV